MAKKADPAFRFFLVVGGLASIVTTVYKYGVSPSTVVFGIVVLIFFGIIVVVFRQIAALKAKDLRLPALILVYFALLLIMAAAITLFVGAYFDAGVFPTQHTIIMTMRPPTEEMSAEEAYKLGLQLWVGPNANYKEAFRYFTIAADKDYPSAFGQIGWMYELGLVPTGADCTKAMELYRKGYSKGVTNTAWNIGRLYDIGCGVPRDNHLARCWYERAQANGLPEATRDLNAMRDQGRLESATCPPL